MSEEAMKGLALKPGTVKAGSLQQLKVGGAIVEGSEEKGELHPGLHRCHAAGSQDTL